MEEQKTLYPSFKSHILLPVIFILTTAVGVCFLVVDGFTVDLSGFIVWFYFAVVLAYIAIAIIDAVLNKTRTNKLKMTIFIMSAVTFLSAIFYLITYLIA